MQLSAFTLASQFSLHTSQAIKWQEVAITKQVTHPTKTSEACQDFIIEEAGLVRISQGLVQEVVNEVDARFNRQYHAWDKDTGSSKTPKSWQINAFHTLHRQTKEPWNSMFSPQRLGAFFYNTVGPMDCRSTDTFMGE